MNDTPPTNPTVKSEIVSIRELVGKIMQNLFGGDEGKDRTVSPIKHPHKIDEIVVDLKEIRMDLEQIVEALRGLS